jgi:hypothetical protein
MANTTLVTEFVNNGGGFNEFFNWRYSYSNPFLIKEIT